MGPGPGTPPCPHSAKRRPDVRWLPGVATGAQRRSHSPAPTWAPGCSACQVVCSIRAPAEGGDKQRGKPSCHELRWHTQVTAKSVTAASCPLRWAQPGFAGRDSRCSWGPGPTGLPVTGGTHVLEVVGLRVPSSFLQPSAPRPRCSWPGGHRSRICCLSPGQRGSVFPQPPARGTLLWAGGEIRSGPRVGPGSRVSWFGQRLQAEPCLQQVHSRRPGAGADFWPPQLRGTFTSSWTSWGAQGTRAGIPGPQGALLLSVTALLPHPPRPGQRCRCRNRFSESAASEIRCRSAGTPTPGAAPTP